MGNIVQKHRTGIFYSVAIGFVVITYMWAPYFQGRRTSRTFGTNVSTNFFIHPTYSNIPSHPITLVTSYFPLGTKSKHTEAEYRDWMTNFLSKVSNPVLVFTTPDSADMIKSLRRNKPMEVITLTDVWSTPPSSKWKELYPDMHAHKDREKSRHSPELYAVWNLKPWFLLQASHQLNPWDSTYFFWVDIGCFRDSKREFPHFPDRRIVEQTFKSNEGRMHFFTVSKFKTKNRTLEQLTYEDLDVDFVIGTFFGGTKVAIEGYAAEYYRLHDYFISHGKFVGKDQVLMNWYVVHNQDRVMTTSSAQQTPWTAGCGDPWFYFQRWYSPCNNGSLCIPNAPVGDVQHLLE